MKKIFIVGFIVAFVTLLCIYGLREFRIKKIIITSEMTRPYGLDILNEKNTLFLDTASLSNALLFRNPEVKSVHIAKQLPETVLLTFTMRKPFAMIKKGEFRRAIDEEGVLLSTPVGTVQFPTIEVFNVPVYSGQHADWRIRKALKYFKQFEEYGIVPTYVTVHDHTSLYVFITQTGEEVRIPMSVEPETTAFSLQVIISRFRIEGKQLAVVDFQYGKPIVLFANGEKNSSL